MESACKGEVIMTPAYSRYLTKVGALLDDKDGRFHFNLWEGGPGLIVYQKQPESASGSTKIVCYIKITETQIDDLKFIVNIMKTVRKGLDLGETAILELEQV